MMASDWSAEVAAQPIGNKKGHDSFNRQIVLTLPPGIIKSDTLEAPTSAQ